MSEGIAIALIGFAGVIVTNLLTSSRNTKKIVDDVNTKVNEKINEVKLEFVSYKSSTDEQIKELTREVRKHNNFAERMPVVENDIKHIEEEIREYHK